MKEDRRDLRCGPTNCPRINCPPPTSSSLLFLVGNSPQADLLHSAGALSSARWEGGSRVPAGQRESASGASWAGEVEVAEEGLLCAVAVAWGPLWETSGGNGVATVSVSPDGACPGLRMAPDEAPSPPWQWNQWHWCGCSKPFIKVGARGRRKGALTQQVGAGEGDPPTHHPQDFLNPCYARSCLCFVAHEGLLLSGGLLMVLVPFFGLHLPATHYAHSHLAPLRLRQQELVLLGGRGAAEARGQQVGGRAERRPGPGPSPQRRQPPPQPPRVRQPRRERLPLRAPQEAGEGPRGLRVVEALRRSGMSVRDHV